MVCRANLVSALAVLPVPPAAVAGLVADPAPTFRRALVWHASTPYGVARGNTSHAVACDLSPAAGRGATPVLVVSFASFLDVMADARGRQVLLDACLPEGVRR